MKINDCKLIILRGNSGSGKSTVALKLRENASTKTAYISQDYLRRIILKEKENLGKININLIFNVVKYCLANDYNVILEGILKLSRHEKLLKRLVKLCPKYYIYYFDISFEETLRRHNTKPNSSDFGEEEMRKWYVRMDTSNLPGEVIIPETYNFDKIVSLIQSQTGI